MAKKSIGGNKMSGTFSDLDWISETQPPAEVKNESPPKTKLPKKRTPARQSTSKKTPMTRSEAPESPKRYVRKTYYVRPDHIDKIESWAFQQKVKQKDVVEQALEEFFADKKMLKRG